MGSNVAFALRSILRKDLPKDFKVRMDGENERDYFYTVTLNNLHESWSFEVITVVQSLN